ncbi:helix-turn-helix domain-containing protein [Bradyrhizobium sp. USDA 4508]
MGRSLPAQPADADASVPARDRPELCGWRQRVRLLEALARLGAGEAVTCVALDVGYESPSAFAAMFKRELGAAPRQYLRWADPEVVMR